MNEGFFLKEMVRTEVFTVLGPCAFLQRVEEGKKGLSKVWCELKPFQPLGFMHFLKKGR